MKNKVDEIAEFLVERIVNKTWTPKVLAKELQEVAIPHGKWIVTERGCVITCSECNERVELYYPDGTATGLLPFCPYCGAKCK